jgi:hypothetical protein
MREGKGGEQEGKAGWAIDNQTLCGEKQTWKHTRRYRTHRSHIQNQHIFRK